MKRSIYFILTCLSLHTAQGAHAPQGVHRTQLAAIPEEPESAPVQINIIEQFKKKLSSPEVRSKGSDHIHKLLVDEMISQDPDFIHERDADGNTPYLLAIQYNQLGTAKYLLSKGADIFAKDNNQKDAQQYLEKIWNFDPPQLRARKNSILNQITATKEKQSAEKQQNLAIKKSQDIIATIKQLMEKAHDPSLTKPKVQQALNDLELAIKVSNYPAINKIIADNKHLISYLDEAQRAVEKKIAQEANIV